jgi:hypothetical protein
MLSLNEIQKLKELANVIFRDVEKEDDAFELLDSEEFQVALKNALDAWDWDGDQKPLLEELREARMKLESIDETYYIVLLDILIDEVKERIKQSETR